MLKYVLLTSALVLLVIPLAVTISLSSITPDVETEPVKGWFDAADDPAIWVHPTDPDQSKIIGTDKLNGLEVYDLKGKKLEAYSFGRINNVDVRYNFPLGNKKIDIVGATEKESDTVVLYSISLDGTLTSVNGNVIKPHMTNVYGFSFYHSLRTGKFYALVTGKMGEFEQFELYDNGKGKIDGKSIRQFKLSSTTEGVVADDEYGSLYIGEEKKGLWRFHAEPGDDTGILVDPVDGKRLKPDLEGLTIYYASDGNGYLIASNQGNNSYTIYDRYNNQFLGEFEIEEGTIDGTWDTDGIDVQSFGLGSIYPDGLFIAQDGWNTDEKIVKRQNFKLVSWPKIADRFDLITDTKVNPRKLVAR